MSLFKSENKRIEQNHKKQISERKGFGVPAENHVNNESEEWKKNIQIIHFETFRFFSVGTGKQFFMVHK